MLRVIKRTGAETLVRAAPQLTGVLAGLYARLGSLRNARERALFARELAIKLHLTAVVTAVHVDRRAAFWDAVALELSRCEDFPPFVLEGVAFKYFGLHPDEHLRHVMTAGTPFDDMTCPTQISMCHIGLGMALALRYSRRFLQASTDSARRAQVLAFLDACEAGSLPGYTGCVVEAMGLVSELHFSGRALVQRWIELLLERPGRRSQARLRHYVALLYHGLGRILFFNPRLLIPRCGGHLKYQALLDARALVQELSSRPLDAEIKELAARNVVAGLLWAVTATSLTEPELLLDYLRFLETSCPELTRYSAAITDGIRTNLLMLRLAEPLTGGARRPDVERRFFAFQPSAARDRERWTRYVTVPNSRAQPALAASRGVEYLYRV